MIQGEPSHALEDGADRLVFAAEAQPHQAIPLQKVDGGWRVPRLDAHHAAVHLGRGAEVVFADLLLHVCT
eukprot:1157860-Pelagomonas_calceolata.AAC.5